MNTRVIEAIEALESIEKEATNAPWIHQYEDGEPSDWVVLDENDGVAEALNGPYDAALIAAGRNMLPALLMCARALVSTRLYDERSRNPYGHDCCWCGQCYDRMVNESKSALFALAAAHEAMREKGEKA